MLIYAYFSRFLAVSEEVERSGDIEGWGVFVKELNLCSTQTYPLDHCRL